MKDKDDDEGQGQRRKKNKEQEQRGNRDVSMRLEKEAVVFNGHSHKKDVSMV